MAGSRWAGVDRPVGPGPPRVGEGFDHPGRWVATAAAHPGAVSPQPKGQSSAAIALEAVSSTGQGWAAQCVEPTDGGTALASPACALGDEAEREPVGGSAAAISMQLRIQTGRGNYHSSHLPPGRRHGPGEPSMQKVCNAVSPGMAAAIHLYHGKRTTSTLATAGEPSAGPEKSWPGWPPAGRG